MPGRCGSPDVGDLGVAGQQAVDERAVAVAGAGVHHQAGRLVDDDDVVVDVDDRDARRCGSGCGQRRRPRTRPGRRRARRRRRAGRRRGWRPRRRPARRPSATSARRLGAADAGDHGDDAVDALAGRALGHGDLARSGRRLGRHGGARKLAITSEDRADHDGGVGDVEHRPPLQVDEVDRPHRAGSRRRPGRHGRAGCPPRRRRSGPTATAPSG